MITNDAYKIKVGSSEAARVYKGSDLIWDSGNSHVYVSGTTRVSGQGGTLPSFGSNTSIKSFSIIGDTLTTLPDQALENCAGLTTVNLGSSITGIGERAFYGCTGLTSINIPASVDEIKKEGFATSSLTGIDISNCTGIGSGAFQLCQNLTSIRLPTGLNTLGDHAFSGCTGLEVIRMMSDNPPTHDALSPAFASVHSNAKVYVKLSASGNWGSTFGGLDVEPIIVQDTFQLTHGSFTYTFEQKASGSAGSVSYRWQSDESSDGEFDNFDCIKRSASVGGTTGDTWRIEQTSTFSTIFYVDPRSSSANAATPFDVGSDWIRATLSGDNFVDLESGLSLNLQNATYSDTLETGILSK